jgi:hypothetical protein
MTERIMPTNDLAFKKIMTTHGNEDILQGIIGDFFDFRPEIGDINITIPYSIKAYQEVFRTEDGEEIWAAKLREIIRDVSADIKFVDFGAEIQIRKEAFFTERSLHYTFSRFCGNYNRRGEMKTRADGRFYLHSSLKPVYTLNILGYKFFPGDDDALRVMTLYDRKRHKAFEIEYVTVAYFELTKNNVESENQRHWKIFFTTGEASEDAPEYIRKAARVIDRANLNREEQDMIDRLEMAEEIYQNTLYATHLDGIEEGAKIERKQWQSVIADKDAMIAAVIADKDAVIAKLRAQLGESAN